MLGIASAFFKDDIRALVSTYGNVGGDQTYINMINLAGVLDINCEFIKGSMYPLGKDNFVSTDYHGKDGLCGVEIAERINPFPTNGDFLQRLYDIIKSHKNIKYIAVGPLTNFAELTEKFPDVADYIGELIIMGGGFEVSNVENNAEYNFSCDPAAVRKVLACPVNKTLAPLDMTHKLAFSPENIEDMTGVKHEALTGKMSNAADILAKLFYLNYETAVRNNEEGAIIHDAATLAYLRDKNKCGVREYKIISDEYGAVSKNPDGYPVNVIEKIDRDFVKDLFKEMFYEYK